MFYEKGDLLVLKQRSISWRTRACRMRSCLLFALAGLLFLLACLASNEAWACPTCKQGVAENDPAGQAMAAGYFYSILFMMSMPFLVLGTLGSCAYWSICRARASSSFGQGSNCSSNAIHRARA